MQCHVTRGSITGHSTADHSVLRPSRPPAIYSMASFSDLSLKVGVRSGWSVCTLVGGPPHSGDSLLLCYPAKHRPCSPCVLARTRFSPGWLCRVLRTLRPCALTPSCNAAHPHVSGSGQHSVQPSPASMVCVSKLRVRGTCDDCHRAEILGFNSELYTAFQVKYLRRLKSERSLDPLHAIRGQYVPGPTQPC